MSDQLLDFASDDQKTGFRLQNFQVYNWGTFHKQVWNLSLQGENTLLTGDIGSGKSTLVDGLSTLLVAPQKITYNKAAGAETRERSLRSYVQGHFKSERSEEGLSARAVALRDHNSYTVLLGQFHNQGFGLHVTLAQVYWIKDPQAQPSRFYVIADKALTIAQDFSGFGSDIGDLRKKLRLTEGVEIFDAYLPYAAAFRRRFGIENDQALDLLNQTISMKSVGNLTDFVRTHMLEPFDPQPRIDALIGHFGDLSQAHKAVMKAKDQIGSLEPLIQDVQKHREISLKTDQLVQAREGLRPWFAIQKCVLLEKRLGTLGGDRLRLENKIKSLGDEKVRQYTRRDELKQALADGGGHRLEALKLQVRELQNLTELRHGKFTRLVELCEPQKLMIPESPEAFGTLALQVKETTKIHQDSEADLQNQKTELDVRFFQEKNEIKDLVKELESLKQRPSNIPQAQIALRHRLCSDLGLPEESMPFAGELLEVNQTESSWTGAAERILHNFALSLLVPEVHYPGVVNWVEKTQLGQKLVYYRIREEVVISRQDPHPHSLVHKLRIKSGSRFRDWLEGELIKRFDVACCETMDEFRREKQALTQSGQIKGGGDRHEKDDRHRVEDRSRWVLGWSNLEKIRYLEKQRLILEKTAADTGILLAQVMNKIKILQDYLRTLALLGEFRDYAEVDWRTPSALVEKARTEIDELEAASSQLKILSGQLSDLDKSLVLLEKDLGIKLGEMGSLESKIQSTGEQLTQVQQTALGIDPSSPLASQIRIMVEELIPGLKLTVESCESRESEVRGEFQKRIDNEKDKLKNLLEKCIRSMTRFRDAWPLETRELDASLEATSGWEKLLLQLKSDDLPRFEDHFKKLLNENTIREVANFQSVLTRDKQSIKEKIHRINQSLTQIEYNPGRFIRLEVQNSPDPEVRDFYQDLRSCTEGSLTGSGDQYSEAKFLQVQSIIQRLQGREGFGEIDRKWTLKVTDVRQAFVFSASERVQETQEEFEHYTDSSGKSGGQKEKLAYTILAAALAYQFGLEWNEVKSRSFRFVVIDEAFGRGSDESTEYGLRLFKKLRLQLLVVTPLQKIHVIEPYISSVGFVHNLEGRESRLRNINIETYREERDQRKDQ